MTEINTYAPIGTTYKSSIMKLDSNNNVSQITDGAILTDIYKVETMNKGFASYSKASEDLQILKQCKNTKYVVKNYFNLIKTPKYAQANIIYNLYLDLTNNKKFLETLVNSNLIGNDYHQINLNQLNLQNEHQETIFNMVLMIAVDNYLLKTYY